MIIRCMMMVAGPLRSALARSETSLLLKRGVNSSSEAVGQGTVNSSFRLRPLTGETLDHIIREEEKKGVSITQADLASCAERLYKEGQHETALEMFELMGRKKMTFSPSQLTLYVELIAKKKGLRAALDFFSELEPNFTYVDRSAKNWPAYMKIKQMIDEGDNKALLDPLTYVLRIRRE